MAVPWVGRIPGSATVPASPAGCGWAWTSAMQPQPPHAGLGRHPTRPPSGSQPEPEVAGLHSQRHWGWSSVRGSLRRGRTGTGRFGALALEIQRGWCHQSGCHYYHHHHHHRHCHHNRHPSGTAGRRRHHQWRSTCTAGRLGCTATWASRRSRAGQGRPHWQAPRVPLETQDMRLLRGLESWGGQGRWLGRRHHRQAPAPATPPRQPRRHTCCSSLGWGRGPWRGSGEVHWGRTRGLPLAQRHPRGHLWCRIGPTCASTPMQEHPTNPGQLHTSTGTAEDTHPRHAPCKGHAGAVGRGRGLAVGAALPWRDAWLASEVLGFASCPSESSATVGGGAVGDGCGTRSLGAEEGPTPSPSLAPWPSMEALQGAGYGGSGAGRLSSAPAIAVRCPTPKVWLICDKTKKAAGNSQRTFRET